MSDFGTVALICSLALSLYGVVVPHFGVRSNNWNLVRSVQHASILSFLMIRRPPRSTPLYSSAASDVYKRQMLSQTALRVSFE